MSSLREQVADMRTAAEQKADAREAKRLRAIAVVRANEGEMTLGQLAERMRNIPPGVSTETLKEWVIAAGLKLAGAREMLGAHGNGVKAKRTASAKRRAAR
jgi:hypothetical protein